MFFVKMRGAYDDLIKWPFKLNCRPGKVNTQLRRALLLTTGDPEKQTPHYALYLVMGTIATGTIAMGTRCCGFLYV